MTDLPKAVDCPDGVRRYQMGDPKLSLLHGQVERAFGGRTSMDEQIHKLALSRRKMLEELVLSHAAGVHGWRLVEEKSADGLKTRWYFEEIAKT